LVDPDLVGPAIVGIVVGVLGLAGLILMNRNRPILHHPDKDSTNKPEDGERQ
jgi:hypothetical protein